MQATIPHIEAVFGHALSLFSDKFEVKRKLSLEVVSSADHGANFHRFDEEAGIFQMSEDIFQADPVVPLYSLARLAGVVSYKEHPGKTHTLDVMGEMADLYRFEQQHVIANPAFDGASPILSEPVAPSADGSDEGELCPSEEALAILRRGGFWNITHLPPGSGRGAVSYSWQDGDEFMIRSESTMTTDADGTHHFTDTEYRKIRRNHD
ncbi:hypothetical protein D3C71_157820 [compost metagenome]